MLMVIFYSTLSHAEECRRDYDCDSGEECYKGECIRERGECRFNSDCEGTQECDRGRCVEKHHDHDDEHWRCKRNDDCGEDERCRQGRCVDRKSDLEKGAEIAGSVLGILRGND